MEVKDHSRLWSQFLRLDYDPEITFSEKEAPGTRLTGSSRMLMMASCDDLQVCQTFIGATFLDFILQESYENVRVVVDKLKLNES